MSKTLLKIAGQFGLSESRTNITRTVAALSSTLGIEREDNEALSVIVYELTMNHKDYDPEDFCKNSAIEVSYDPQNPRHLGIISSGVMSAAQGNELEEKLKFVKGKDPESLSAIARGMFLDDLPRDTTGPYSTSNGQGGGIVSIAARAKGPLNFCKNDQIAEGFFRFQLEIDCHLGSPIRLDAASSPKPVELNL